MATLPMHSRHGRTAACLVVIAALLMAAPTAAAEWAMDGADPEHTGEQQTPLLGAAEQWETEIDGELLCPPSTAYGRLYVGTSDGYLKVIQASNGDVLWELKLGTTICATPLISTQTAFVPADNVLHAVALTNKTAKWTFEAVGDFTASPVIYGNQIFVGSKDKHLYAIEEYTGDLVWSLKLDDVVAATPSISGNTVIVGTDSGTVFGIDRNDGKEVWHVDLGHAVSTAACIFQDTAMVGTYGGRMHGIDIDGGVVEWTYPRDSDDPLDPILTTPVTNSGRVYFGADGLYCLDASNGAIQWHHETGDTVRGSPAIIESYMVFGCYDGLLRCLDKNSGNVVWRYRSDTVFRSGVSIDYDKAYIGGRDGMLYARSILNSHAPTVIGPFDLMAKAHDSIAFFVNADDPENNLLTYRWDFGDGNTSTEAEPLHAYSVPGEYTATVTVSDGTKTKRHTISVTVEPFQASATGGDEASTPWALIGGAVAAVVVVLVLVLLFILRKRREDEEHPEDQEEGSAEPYPYAPVDGPPVQDGPGVEGAEDFGDPLLEDNWEEPR